MAEKLNAETESSEPEGFVSPADKSVWRLILDLRPGELWQLAAATLAALAIAFTFGVTLARKQIDTPVIPMPAPGDIESAGALIVEEVNGRYAMLGVLHIEERGMVFSPPGGATKDGESPDDTARRETFEETGFTIKNVTFLEKAPDGNRNFSLVAARIDDSEPQEIYHHDGTVGIVWSNPYLIPAGDWRFPQQRNWIIEHFEDIVNQRK